MGIGEGFGEIALLGDTTRTMTIRAAEHVELCRIQRSDFIPAVTSMGEARSAADADPVGVPGPRAGSGRQSHRRSLRRALRHGSAWILDSARKYFLR